MEHVSRAGEGDTRRDTDKKKNSCFTKKGKVMKNIIAFAVCIFILGTTAVMGQTYYYKGVYSVKKQTGMKSESGGGAYITFTDEGCYFSDEMGITKEDSSSNITENPIKRWYIGPGVLTPSINSYLETGTGGSRSR